MATHSPTRKYRVPAIVAGQRYAMLVAVEFSHTVGQGKRGSRTYWRFRCDCGKEIVAVPSDVTSGKQKACGCTRREKTIKRNLETALHGMTGSREHRTWLSMLQRCRDPNHNAYHLYGGAGVIVCERWLTFTNFYADMGPRPEGKTLDRYPNKDGNYEPGNCRWATDSEQNKNRKWFKRNRKIAHRDDQGRIIKAPRSATESSQ
jgi:hypothetical protein